MTSYTGIAIAKGQTPIFYKEYGEYNGAWIMVAIDKDTVYVYKDWYGTCSGCDSLQAKNPVTPEEDEDFAKDYHPFLEIPIDGFKSICERGTFKELLPLNLSYAINTEVVAHSIEDVAVCLWGKPTVEQILALQNAETLRMALEKYGEEQFIRDAGAVLEDSDGDNALYTIDDRYFLWLQDSSTPRKYFIEVAKCDTVRHGIAWSFNIPADYIFLQET